MGDSEAEIVPFFDQVDDAKQRSVSDLSSCFHVRDRIALRNASPRQSLTYAILSTLGTFAFSRLMNSRQNNRAERPLAAALQAAAALGGVVLQHRSCLPVRLELLAYGLVLGGLFLVAQSAQSAEPEPAPTPATVTQTLKFELDIQPILTARSCNSGPCHGKARGQNGFALSLLGFDADMDYNALVKDARGRRVFPAAPEQSLLLQKATGQLPHGGGIRIEPTSDEYRRLIRWIAEGAPRTTAADPRLEKIEISPAPHSLAAQQSEQLTVTAHYSDGSQRNVTDTCAFQSNEPAIVSVSATGQLKAGALPGEATIMARYMGMIATWSTAIPRATPVQPDVYTQLPEHNFIDRLVWNKCQQLQILPSEPVSESTFLRRVYLDTIGKLPTPDEAKQYLNDPGPDRRERLIRQLLDRPEYADYWANKWADLLRPNPYRVGIKATLSLDQWLRDAFRRNLPYDQFVRELLTAQGSTWKNGAVTVFRDRRSPDEITTMVSQLFMGVRLECAKCHQHPFEVYGQKEFYSLAAYFARVGYKGTGLSPPISGGEEMVFVASRGEVKHPLTQQVLAPQPLRGTAREIAADEDPRAVFAEWLTADENEWFAAVAVNRLWAELFGVGIVDPVDDLRATNPPSNPELLSALTAEFRRVKYDQKQLLATMLNSYAYLLSSLPNETNAADPRNFARHYRQRLRAEVLADAIADFTEVPENYEGMPPASRAVELWTHRADSDFLDAFGRPDPNQDPPCERTRDATVVQALHLMNAPAIQAKITNDKGRAARLAASELAPPAIVEELYLAAYSRFPTTEEQSLLASELIKPETPRRQWIEDLMWALVNTPEFIYKD